MKQQIKYLKRQLKLLNQNIAIHKQSDIKPIELGWLLSDRQTYINKINELKELSNKKIIYKKKVIAL